MKRYIINLMFVAVAVLGTVSCSDEAEPTALASPVITLTKATYNTLSFCWKPVNGATQYGYKLTSADGKTIAGEVTSDTTATFTELDMLTAYQFHLWAYPTVEKPEQCLSAEACMSISTPFYSLVNAKGTLKSVFLSSALEEVIIEEKRTQEDKLGTFTIKAFYGKEGKDLTFSVNEDKTIKILNEDATLDTATGYIKVSTGSSTSHIRGGVLIDETRTVFDRPSCTLTFYAKATKGTREGEEVFTWEE